jgi:hypothetical protein
MPIQGSFTGAFSLGHRSSKFDNPVVYLPFDGVDGDTVTSDFTLPRKLVTIYGNAHLVGFGRFGPTSLGLTGGVDRAEISMTPKVYRDFTVEAWQQRNLATYFNPVFSLGIDANNQIDVSTYIGQVRLRIVVDGVSVYDAISNAGVRFNQWQHIALVCQDGNLRISLDGNTVQTNTGVTYPFEIRNVAVGNWIGGGEGLGGSFIGFVDDFRFNQSVVLADGFDTINDITYTTPGFTDTGINEGDLLPVSVNVTNLQPGIRIPVTITDSVGRINYTGSIPLGTNNSGTISIPVQRIGDLSVSSTSIAISGLDTYYVSVYGAMTVTFIQGGVVDQLDQNFLIVGTNFLPNTKVYIVGDAVSPAKERVIATTVISSTIIVASTQGSTTWFNLGASYSVNIVSKYGSRVVRSNYGVVGPVLRILNIVGAIFASTSSVVTIYGVNLPRNSIVIIDGPAVTTLRTYNLTYIDQFSQSFNTQAQSSPYAIGRTYTLTVQTSDGIISTTYSGTVQ